MSVKITMDKLLALNQLYDLNLTDNEYKNYSDEIKNIGTYISDAKNKVEEISCRSNYRISLFLRKADLLVMHSFDSDDTDYDLNRQRIDVIHIDKENISFYDKWFPINAQKLGVTVPGAYFRTAPSKYILFLDSYNLTDLNQLALLTQQNSICTNFIEYENDILHNFAVINLNTLENHFVDFLDSNKYIKSELANCRDLYNSGQLYSVDAIMKFLESMSLPNLKCTSIKPTLNQYLSLTQSQNQSLIEQIIKIIEVKNIRICQIVQGATWGTNLQTSIIVGNHKAKDYNYLDLGRIFICLSKYNEVQLYKTYARPQAHILLDLPPTVPTNVIVEYLANKSKTSILSNTDLDNIAKHLVLTQMQYKQTEDQKRALSQKLNIKLEDLRLNGIPITLNEITFSKDAITYQDQSLKLNTTLKSESNWCVDIIKKALQYVSLTQLDFDLLLKTFIGNVINKWSYPIKGHIGDVEFNLECVTSTDKASRLITRYTINGHRVNKSEVSDILALAINYTDQADFDSFISDASKCSLETQQLISKGLVIQAQDLVTDKNLIISIPLVRKKGKNYVVLNDKYFSIADTARLKAMETNKGYYKLTTIEVIDKLTNEKIVKDLSMEEAGQLIACGIKAYEASKERTEKLLNSVIKKFNITEEDKICLDNHVTLEHAYIVPGKLRTYCVDKKSHKVYTYTDGQYICMINKGHQHQGTDMLISKLLALCNDSKIAKVIETLNI